MDRLTEFAAGFDPLWQRFLDATPEGLTEKSLALPKARPELESIWLASEFVANWCIRWPEQLFELVDSGELDRPRTPGETSEALAQWVDGAVDESGLGRGLRQFRNREMVRIAWRDLAGFSQVEETMEDVSALADASIDQALRKHQQWLSRKFGVPMIEPLGAPGNKQATAIPANMVVMGMGKLGGRELNYSSDIDLIFAYDGAGTTDISEHPGARSLDNQEFFIKLGRKIIASLDPITTDGFVFRTDMRLRPNGDSGPLTLSFAAMEHYYQTHGRGWERYALIKARIVAGDKVSGDELMSMLRPFVYRKYLDFSAFDSIRNMKRMIILALRKKGAEDDIKLGWGGIREVEFFVQSHQLIRGGRARALQTPFLYLALDGLVELGIVAPADRDQLVESYRFLRNSEHRLQMFQDRQTQQLPAHHLDRLRLARSMGFDHWDAYVQQLSDHRAQIHNQFTLILDSADDSDQRKEVIAPDRDLASIWAEINDRSYAVDRLEKAGFNNPESTYLLLKGFKEGRLYQIFSGSEHNRIDRLIPLALKQAVVHAESERATAAFIGVLESIGRRAAYLSLLIENPLALKQLLHLCAASPWLSRHIGNHPVILDELLSPFDHDHSASAATLDERLQGRLAEVEANDDEAIMNVLREFHHGHVLQVAAADVSGLIEVETIQHSLGQLAEVLLAETFSQAMAAVQKKLAIQGTVAGVIAYGKFASGELGYNSDLDIVICFEHQLDEEANTAQRGEAEYFYSRVSRRMIHLLTTRTPAGTLYELDMRLRPSGRSGTLVTSLNGFLEYQLNSAWTWEHQALVRARPVVADPEFAARFEAVRKQVLCIPRNPGELKSDILSMRNKMIAANCQSNETDYDIKLDHGGIVDIEFLVQYWVLGHAFEQPGITEPRSTKETLAALAQAGIIPPDTASALTDIYTRYLRKSLDLKLMDSPVVVPQGELRAQRDAVSSIWQATFASG